MKRVIIIIAMLHPPSGTFKTKRKRWKWVMKNEKEREKSVLKRMNSSTQTCRKFSWKIHGECFISSVRKVIKKKIAAWISSTFCSLFKNTSVLKWVTAANAHFHPSFFFNYQRKKNKKEIGEETLKGFKWISKKFIKDDL